MIDPLETVWSVEWEMDEGLFFVQPDGSRQYATRHHYYALCATTDSALECAAKRVRDRLPVTIVPWAEVARGLTPAESEPPLRVITLGQK